VIRVAGDAHRDFLARIVNQAARPYAMTQWFRRGQDGIGQGESGLRLPHEWRGRKVPAECFPNCWCGKNGIVDWNSRLLAIIIAGWRPCCCCGRASSLETRRSWRSRPARSRAGWPGYTVCCPTRIDPARIQAALVAARMEEALSDAGPNELM
jgi:hypothetical protein